LNSKNADNKKGSAFVKNLAIGGFWGAGQKGRTTMKKGAFTLIELLVVIAIIALLLALLMPALRLAKDQAAALLCVNNLKNMSMGWFTYTVDHDGMLMGGHRYRGTAYNNKSVFPDGFWINPPHNASGSYFGELNGPPDGPPTLEDKLRGIRTGHLFPYCKDVDLFHCPFDARIDIPEQMAHCSYSVAGGMNGEPAYQGSSGKTRPDLVAEVFDEIRSPANKYVFVEETDDRGWNMGSWIMNYSAGTWIDPLAGWHNDRSTLGFADGHASKIRWRDDRTITMNENQDFGQNHPGSPDMLYMLQGYVSGKNK
jgi:prepilin-type N-terminal cleavage/methylation domain-containing protein/prepilin-type processing-associated H-X9-DG protein